jgi:flagellar hook-basal body complex protein FliE
MTHPPVPPIGPAQGVDALAPTAPSSAIPGAGPVSGAGAFANLLNEGIGNVEQKVTGAEQLATAFAVDDSVPLHQVTFALQQARLSLEFLLQVRNRLVEAYQQFAAMQL